MPFSSLTSLLNRTGQGFKGSVVVGGGFSEVVNTGGDEIETQSWGAVEIDEEFIRGDVQVQSWGAVRVTTPATYILSTGTKSPVGASGMTQLVSSSQDDAAQTIALPFAVKFYGDSISTIYPCSNSFIALQYSDTSYTGLTMDPPNPLPLQRTIHLGSDDNSWQRLYTYSDPDGNFFRVRFEGRAAASGTPGSPNIVWETTFFQPQGSVQYIEVVFGTHNRPSGVFGITNGFTGGSNINTNGGTITPNQSYVFQSDGNGDGWTITANRYITIS